MRALILVACLAVAAAATSLFGTYSPFTTDGIFTELNNWMQQANSGNGPQQAVRVVEIGWSAPDPNTGHVAAIDSIRQTWGWNGAVPLVTWMPYGYKAWASPTPNEDIVSGLYDDYIDAFLSQLSTTYVFEPNVPVKRLWLRFAPAPNGNWFPWSPFCPGCSSLGQRINQTAASYVSMWKYVMKKVRDPKYNLTQDTVQVMFDAATSCPSGAISSFAPPDETVDWFGMTGINWGNSLPGNQWVTPGQLFDQTLAALRALNATKPVGVTSSGTTSQPNGVEAKASWLTSMCSWVVNNNMKMYTYHNADSSTDVAVFGGSTGPATFPSPVSNETYKMYPTFRDCIVNSNGTIVGRSETNPRYISGALFAGTA